MTGDAPRRRPADRDRDERRDGAHGHEPAPRAVDRGDPRPGRRPGRTGRGPVAGAAARRPRRAQAARARRGARARALHDRPRRGARRPGLRGLLRRAGHQPPRRPRCARRSRPASTSTARSRSARTSRRRSSCGGSPRTPASSTASCRTSCSCPGCGRSRACSTAARSAASSRCAASSATGSSPARSRRRSARRGTTAREDGGGIIADMFSHWRYVLDDLFGNVEGVFALGATHLPTRYDEASEPYDATAEDAAYAIFELAGGVVAQLNSSWCVRVDRDELFELQVDGTEGTAVAGLRDCRIQPGAATPRSTWNPDLPDPVRHREAWLPVPGERARQRVQVPVGALPAPRRARRAVRLGLRRRGARRPARRAGPEVVARAALDRGAGAVTTAVGELRLPRADGALEPYAPGEPAAFDAVAEPPASRVALAAAHVVADPLAYAPGGPAVLDWEATLAFRRHLWAHGLGVAEAMDTAQRGMGLDWPAARELIRRSAAEARACGGRIAAGAGTDHLTAGTLAEVRARLRGAVRVRRGHGRAGDRDGLARARRRRHRGRRLPRGLRRGAGAARAARDPALARRGVRPAAARLLGRPGPRSRRRRPDRRSSRPTPARSTASRSRCSTPAARSRCGGGCPTASACTPATTSTTPS